MQKFTWCLSYSHLGTPSSLVGAGLPFAAPTVLAPAPALTPATTPAVPTQGNKT